MDNIGRHRNWYVSRKFFYCLLVPGACMEWSYSAYGNIPGDFTLLRQDTSCCLTIWLWTRLSFFLTGTEKYFCVCTWQLCNFQTGGSIFPYYFLQVSISHTQIHKGQGNASLFHIIAVTRNLLRKSSNRCLGITALTIPFFFNSPYLGRNQELIFL